MSDFRARRIAITGSNGQLGQEFARIAAQFPSYEFIFLSRKEFPLDDTEKITSWLSQNQMDFFINSAAYTAVDKAESETEKAFQINALAPSLIAGKLAEFKIPMIQISTDYVFDGYSSSPLNEEAVTEPVNQYGATKLAGERGVLRNNPDSQVIRTSWLYSSYGNNFVKTMMRLMKEKPLIRVVNDQIGSPTYAGDLALALMQMISSGRFVPGIFHFSNEGVTSWYEFALEIKRLTGSFCEVLPIPTSAYPTPAKRPAYSLMDKSKLKNTYDLVIPEWKTSLAACMEQIKMREV